MNIVLEVILCFLVVVLPLALPCANPYLISMLDEEEIDVLLKMKKGDFTDFYAYLIPFKEKQIKKLGKKYNIKYDIYRIDSNHTRVYRLS